MGYSPISDIGDSATADTITTIISIPENLVVQSIFMPEFSDAVLSVVDNDGNEYTEDTEINAQITSLSIILKNIGASNTQTKAFILTLLNNNLEEGTNSISVSTTSTYEDETTASADAELELTYESDSDDDDDDTDPTDEPTTPTEPTEPTEPSEPETPVTPIDPTPTEDPTDTDDTDDDTKTDDEPVLPVDPTPSTPTTPSETVSNIVNNLISSNVSSSSVTVTERAESTIDTRERQQTESVYDVEEDGTTVDVNTGEVVEPEEESTATPVPSEISRTEEEANKENAVSTAQAISRNRAVTLGGIIVAVIAACSGIIFFVFKRNKNDEEEVEN